MNRNYLIDTIEKYHLNGLTERVKITIKDKQAIINFITEQKNLLGTVISPDIDLEDCEIGIYNTSQLLKLLNITDDLLSLNLESKNTVPIKLLIADKEFNLEYYLADISLTPQIPEVSEPVYDMEADIDNEFILRCIKGRKALDTAIFTVESIIDETSVNCIRFTLGGKEAYTNKISFTIPTTKPGIPGGLTTFPIDEFREILDNNKIFTSAKLYVSEQGLLKLEFENNKQKSTYYLIAKEN